VRAARRGSLGVSSPAAVSVLCDAHFSSHTGYQPLGVNLLSEFPGLDQSSCPNFEEISWYSSSLRDRHSIVDQLTKEGILLGMKISAVSQTFNFVCLPENAGQGLGKSVYYGSTRIEVVMEQRFPCVR
jgi:hypothetical protein